MGKISTTGKRRHSQKSTRTRCAVLLPPAAWLAPATAALVTLFIPACDGPGVESPVGEKPGIEKPAEGNPAIEKLVGEDSTGENSTDEKPAVDHRVPVAEGSATDYVDGSKREQVSPMFRRMHVNTEQQVTRKEFLGLWRDAFRNQDQDGNGMLDEAEFGHPVFKQVDFDQNRQLTFTKFKNLYSVQFEQRDKYQRGTLTLDEM